MCIGILTRWVPIRCLKLLDEFSKMCSWMNEVHSNYSRQRELHGARRNVYNYSDLLTYRDKSHIEKRFWMRSVEGQASRSDARYLFFFKMFRQIFFKWVTLYGTFGSLKDTVMT